MKQRRYLRLGAMLTAIALFMSLFLLGCGGSSGNGGGDKYSASAPAASAAPAPSPGEPADNGFYADQDFSFSETEETDGSSTGGTPQFVMPDTRKIIRHVSMNLETREFANALQSIQQTVADRKSVV